MLEKLVGVGVMFVVSALLAWAAFYITKRRVLQAECEDTGHHWEEVREEFDYYFRCRRCGLCS